MQKDVGGTSKQLIAQLPKRCWVIGTGNAKPELAWTTRKKQKKGGDKKNNDAKSGRTEILRKKWQEEYREKDKLVKRSLRRDKRAWANDIDKEAEEAENLGNIKGV